MFWDINNVKSVINSPVEIKGYVLGHFMLAKYDCEPALTPNRTMY